jgi:hypothetical protein
MVDIKCLKCEYLQGVGGLVFGNTDQNSQEDDGYAISFLSCTKSSL